MRRIVVVGPWGAGKSTLAVQIGQALGREVVHLDALFWKSGWVATAEAEQDRLLEEVLTWPEWVIEGDHPRTQDSRFAAADAIVFLDYPRALCLRRALVRTIRGYGRPRLGGAPGCPERPALRVFKWILRYPKRRRPLLMQRIQEHAAHAAVHILATPAEAETWLQSLRDRTDSKDPKKG